MRRFDWFVVAALALMAVGNVAMFVKESRDYSFLYSYISGVRRMMWEENKLQDDTAKDMRDVYGRSR